jgi:short-subunit dehydrogenase
LNLALVARRADLLQSLAAELSEHHRVETRTLALDLSVADAAERVAIRTPNYEASGPEPTGSLSDSTMEPDDVVREALGALGRQPYVLPGRMNRIASLVMHHILPCKLAVQFMGGILRDLYAKGGEAVPARPPSSIDD